MLLGAFLHGAKHSSSTSASPGAILARTQPVTIGRIFIKLRQFQLRPGPNEIAAGPSEATGNSFDIPGEFWRPSQVGNRPFYARTKFEKAKFRSKPEVAQKRPK